MKRLISFLIIGWLSVGLAHAQAVARSDNGDSSTNVSCPGSVSSIDLTTFSVTSASNLMLVAFLQNANTVTSSSATWDSVAMTSQGVAQSTERVELFTLANPHTGNKTLHTAWTTSRASCVTAIAFSNGTAFANFNSNSSASSATDTVTITSTAGGATVAGTVASNALTLSTGTSIEAQGATTPHSNASFILSGTSNAHTWTQTAGRFAIVGISITPVSGGTCSMTTLGVGTCGDQ